MAAVLAFYSRGKIEGDARLLDLVVSTAAQLGTIVRRRVAEAALAERALLAELTSMGRTRGSASVR